MIKRIEVTIVFRILIVSCTLEKILVSLKKYETYEDSRCGDRCPSKSSPRRRCEQQDTRSGAVR